MKCTAVVMAGLVSVSAMVKADLVGYWKFSASDPAGTAVDYATADGAQNGTINSWGVNANLVGSYGGRTDVLEINQAADGGYVLVSSVGASGDNTWAAWVNLSSLNTRTAGYPMIITNSSGGGREELRYLSTFGRPEVLYNGATTAQSAVAVTVNTWHFIVQTRVGSAVTLYQDGVQRGTGTASTAQAVNLDFGCRGGGVYYLQGRLDDINIWNEGLSLGKVKALYDPIASYDVLAMSQVFHLYDVTGSGSVNGQRWLYASGLIGHQAGDHWTDGPLTYLQLDSSGNGMVAVPEPAMPLALCGLAGLWLRRRTNSRN